jgi:hypothetical protein
MAESERSSHPDSKLGNRTGQIESLILDRELCSAPAARLMPNVWPIGGRVITIRHERPETPSVFDTSTS